MKGRRCIVSLGVDDPMPDAAAVRRDFRPGLRRLAASLASAGYADGLLMWEDRYPEGSPSHAKSPYGFKPFCFAAAAAQGFEVILWLDASVKALRPLDALFEGIERDGYLFFRELHSVGEFCKDEALAPLGLTREAAFAMPSCWACAIGLDLRQPRAREFLDTWRALAIDGVTFPGPRWSGLRGAPRLASPDARVKGHRHDQTAASVVALRLGLDRWRPRREFFTFFDNERWSIPTLPSGPRAEAAPGPGPAGPGETAVLFFSSGRGEGHATADLAIVEDLRRLRPELKIQFVSYAANAAALRAAGWPVIDLRVPEGGRFLSVLGMARTLIAEVRPAVVIAHEEHAVLPAAAMERVPSMLLADWFPPAQHVAGEALGFADAILFLGAPGVSPVPAFVRCEPLYVGPVVRRMKYTLSDRSRARRELGIPEGALAIAVIPGASATEQKAPAADLVLAAFRRFAPGQARLLWLAGEDAALLQALAAALPQVQVIETGETVEQIMVASDVVLTKGNHDSVLEAASLGVPSISLGFGADPVVDARVATIKSNVALQARALTPAILHAYLEQLGGLAGSARPAPLGLHEHGGANVAAALAEEMDRVRLDRREGAVPASNPAGDDA